MDYDIPYEEAVIKRYEEVILCASKHLDREVTIAEYSTEAKAIKAMKMMREKYLSRMELEGGPTLNDNYVQPNFWVLPKVFQFPKDDEVTV